MQDRPTRVELLQGVEHTLRESLMPALEGADQFRARVAANVVRMVVRELETGEAAQREEYASLAVLLNGSDPAPDTLEALERALLDMNETLARKIRDGEADTGAYRAQLLAHLRAVTLRKLDITDPKLATKLRDEYDAG